MGNIYDWAKEEVRLACEKEHPNKNPDEWDYGCACYESALKAFKALCEDGHSGMSISLTKNILNRLIDNKPLTPIEDTPEIWNHVYTTPEGVKQFQCSRMSSLFKDVYCDGSVKFNNTNRFICVNLNDNDDVFHSGLVNRTLNDMFPINLPYYPLSKPIRVYIEEFLVDKSHGDFDTVGIFYMQNPDGGKININRFFTEGDNGNPWKEITEAEYIDLKSRKVAP